MALRCAALLMALLMPALQRVKQQACAVGATYLNSIGFADAEVRVADGTDQELATCTADG